MVECEMCKKWICRKCHEFVEEEKSIFFLEKEGVHWACKTCDSLFTFILSSYRNGELNEIVNLNDKSENHRTLGNTELAEDQQQKEMEAEQRAEQKAEQQQRNHELLDRIRTLENELSELKISNDKDKDIASTKEQVTKNKIETLEKQNKKLKDENKNDKIKKLKREMSKLKEENTKRETQLDKTKRELNESKETINNLNSLISHLKQLR